MPEFSLFSWKVGLKWFAENVAKKPFTGIVIHSGKDVLPFGEGFYAVPFAALA